MAKVRILGPRRLLSEVVRSVQDLGLLHLCETETVGPLRRAESRAPGRRRRQLERILTDLAALEPRLRLPDSRSTRRPDAARLAAWARLARRLRRRLARAEERRAALGRERALAERYGDFVRAFGGLPAGGTVGEGTRVYRLILRGGSGEEVERFRSGVRSLLGEGFEIHAAGLPRGEVALALLVPAEAARRVDALLARSAIEELPLPRGVEAGTLGEALPALERRRAEIEAELAALDAERAALSERAAPELALGRAAIRDALLEESALAAAGETPHAFVLEGWMPESATGRLRERMREGFGEAVVVEVVSTEAWAGEEAPVALSNPRLFRPFEMITRTFPLPRYGSIDPTPFVAVFFPMFFGLVLGDVAYGVGLAVLAAVLHRRSRPETAWRAVSEIAGSCAAFSIIFGFLFGELLGDVGRRFGLRPLIVDREEALLPFLALTVALGLVHILLGLGLGAVAAFRKHPRTSLGHGVAAAMILLLLAGLLVLLRVLPASFFTPVVIGLLVAFPVLVIAEGIIAPIELLSTIGNILSYARIMALGTASVMMAVVANRMVGALGGAVVGVLFGVLFHLVNFALGIFTPTIHALRLHYVEFFGKFYSPGGVEYRPFAHWRPDGPART